MIIDVQVAHASGNALRTPSGGTTATNIPGFEVTEDNWATNEVINAAKITGASTVRFTLSAPPSNRTNLKIRYLYGIPTASTEHHRILDRLYDNNPVGNPGGMPVWPTLNDVTVNAAP